MRLLKTVALILLLALGAPLASAMPLGSSCDSNAQPLATTMGSDHHHHADADGDKSRHHGDQCRVFCALHCLAGSLQTPGALMPLHLAATDKPAFPADSLRDGMDTAPPLDPPRPAMI